MKQRFTLLFAHLVAWLLFFSLVYGFVFRDTKQEVLHNLFSGPFLLFCCTYLFIFYFNTYLLIPMLYFRKKQGSYLMAIFLLFLFVFWAKPFEQLMVRQNRPAGPQPVHFQDLAPPPPPAGHKPVPADITGIILFVTAWSLSTAICIARQGRLIEQRAVRAEADKAHAELSFLKMQINPHFLFNTLNNIYTLAVHKDENTAPAILKLSNIMRYLTDEVQENLVPLQSEADCVQDYIGLQQLRLNKNTRIDFSREGDFTDKQIAPLILMTFVENAFKHGISNRESSEIGIRLLSEKKYITFYCQNKLFETPRNTERTGIGMYNARQRLQHMYPGTHSLLIKTDNGLYSVHLVLQS